MAKDPAITMVSSVQIANAYPHLPPLKGIHRIVAVQFEAGAGNLVIGDPREHTVFQAAAGALPGFAMLGNYNALLDAILGPDTGTANWVTLSTSSSNTSRTSEISELIRALPDPFAGYDRYEVANWDGYDADPITRETVDAARAFLGLLPYGFSTPAIAPGGDGAIGFEWLRDQGPFRKLFIDIGPGRTWRAYWRLSSGITGKIPQQSIDAKTPSMLTALFRQLSA
jgi:hypothetical protein